MVQLQLPMRFFECCKIGTFSSICQCISYPMFFGHLQSGLKYSRKQLRSGWQSHLNLIRDHMSLQGKTHTEFISYLVRPFRWFAFVSVCDHKVHVCSGLPASVNTGLLCYTIDCCNKNLSLIAIWSDLAMVYFTTLPSADLFCACLNNPLCSTLWK